MGFVGLAVLGIVSFAAFVLLRVERRLWMLVGAALCLGAAGYSWQGRPLLAAAPAHPVVDQIAIDPDSIALRDRLLGNYSADHAYLVASDAMTRSGDTRAAAQVVLGGVRSIPRSFVLWTWLGTTLAADAGDQMSPPALAAFRQAMHLAPEHPAPPFYAGLAYVRAGQFAEAVPYWRHALALSPAGSSFREDIGLRLMLLERFLAAAGNQPVRP